MVTRKQPRWTWHGRVFALLYLLTAVWTLWPVASVAVTNGIAALLDCRLSEGGPLPCHLLGHDISRQMYVGAATFWLALVTLPTGGAALGGIFILDVLIRGVRRWRTRPRQSS